MRLRQRGNQKTSAGAGGAAACLLLLLSCLNPIVGRALASEVVVLKSSDLTPYNVVAAAIVAGGQRDVETITLAADPRKYDVAVHAIWSAKPDVIVALGVKALDVASREFTGIPVVFGMVVDTDGSANRPAPAAGINLLPSPSQVLRAARAVLPQVHQVAVVFDPKRSTDEIEEFAEAGARLGIKVRPVQFSRDAGVENELRSVAGSCDCLIIYPDAVLLSDKVFGDIVFRAFGLGLPTVAYSSAFARKGAVMSVEAEYASVGEDLNDMVGLVLSGASASGLGIRAPSRVKLAVNKSVAEELGIKTNTQPGALPADIAPSIEVIADKPRTK